MATRTAKIALARYQRKRQRAVDWAYVGHIGQFWGKDCILFGGEHMVQREFPRGVFHCQCGVVTAPGEIEPLPW